MISLGGSGSKALCCCTWPYDLEDVNFSSAVEFPHSYEVVAG